MSGTLLAGSTLNPVEDFAKVEIIIANNGPINVNWDKQLLSRGIVAYGKTVMHGQQKTVHMKVLKDPMAGDTTLVMKASPLNWKVGDTLVVAGTRYKGHAWDHSIGKTRPYPSEDEVVKIKSVNGNKIEIDQSLKFDHDTPRSDLKTSVANYTRNVVIRSEKGNQSPVNERGHLMFMHSDKVDVRYVELFELGRTDKSRKARDASTLDIKPNSNVKGRYSLHFHRSGFKNVRHPAIAVGNAVFGSPGWGYVHHDSNVDLINNASYRTFGAGFVAETGNEIGVWRNNIAIFAIGQSWGQPKTGNDFENFDNGQGGDGYWFQGRLVRAIDNIAASVNHGYVYFHRNKKKSSNQSGMIQPLREHFDLPEALQVNAYNEDGKATVSTASIPILSFIDNEVFAAKQGIQVTKSNPKQKHDVRTLLEGMKAWEVSTGTSITYTSHYTSVGFDLVGRSLYKSKIGFDIGGWVSDQTVLGLSVDGFPVAMDFEKSRFIKDSRQHQFVVVEPVVSNIGDQLYATFDKAFDTILKEEDVKPGRFDIRLDSLVYSDKEIKVSGLKIDSMGQIPIPAGDDSYDIKLKKIQETLENDGYRTDAKGKKYMILELYFSDRGTGEVHKFGHAVKMPDNVGKPRTLFKDAVDGGAIDLSSQPPVTIGEQVTIKKGHQITLDLTENDLDPEDDELSVDGIFQPRHGRAFVNVDGTVTIKPDIGFSGKDRMKYWVSDSHGNFSPAFVTINVEP